jgi:hypothetical protein
MQVYDLGLTVRDDLFCDSGSRLRPVPGTTIGVANHFDTDLITGTKVTGCLGARHFIRGFLRNVAHAGLSIPRHQPLIPSWRHFVGHLCHNRNPSSRATRAKNAAAAVEFRRARTPNHGQAGAGDATRSAGRGGGRPTTENGLTLSEALTSAFAWIVIHTAGVTVESSPKRNSIFLMVSDSRTNSDRDAKNRPSRRSLRPDTGVAFGGMGLGASSRPWALNNLGQCHLSNFSIQRW